MSDYTPSGNPVDGTAGDATEIRNEFALIQAAIATKSDTSDIGSAVQAWSENLDEYATTNPTAAGLALLDDADAAAQRATLGLIVGTNVQAYSANLDEYAAVNPTAAGLTLVGAVDAAAQRAAIGLGTLSTQNGTFSGTSSGTNTGDNAVNTLYSGLVSNATHTGDVTGATALTIANDAVTYAKMQNVSATDKLLGRSTAGAGDVEEITCTAAGRALLDDADATAQRVTLGLVIGTNVQAYDADLTTWAGVTPGTNVATALGVAVGSAGAVVVNGGALGTPLTGTLTNCGGTAASLTSGITNALKSATTTVNVSSATAPSSGQVLTATGSTAATWQTPASGKLIQTVEATPIATVVSCSGTIPFDDTIPQNTEGTQVITVTITPTSASNRLRIEFDAGFATGSTTEYAVSALFQDSTASALATSVDGVAASVPSVALRLGYEMAAGTTSATTFKIRCGMGSGTLYINGDNAGGRRFGGSTAARLRVTEYTP